MLGILYHCEALHNCKFCKVACRWESSNPVTRAPLVAIGQPFDLASVYWACGDNDCSLLFSTSADILVLTNETTLLHHNTVGETPQTIGIALAVTF